MPTTLNVKTSVYEGPLDLLLDLIEKRKLLVNDISLAEVTDEYIARVSGMQELPVGETAQFIALAATLLLIKSRSLLPSLELSDEESHDIKELEYRLALYQLIKQAAGDLRRSLNNPPLWEGAERLQEALFIPDTSVTPSALRAAAQALIDGFPTTLELPKVNVKKIMSIEEMIERLAARVNSAIKLSFNEFAGKNKSAGKHEIIVSFLAMLELVKQGIINATQEGSEITMESHAVGTPSYE